MRLNDILVCLDTTPAGDERLDAAIRLARANDARLTGVYPFLDEAVEGVLFPADRLAAVAIGGGRFPARAEPGLAAADPVVPAAARAGVAEERFHDRLRTHGTEGDWHVLDGANATELIELAKTADLVVLAQFERGAHGRTVFRPEEIALACGRPVLIIPYAGSFAAIGTRVLVAWDATREAARALHDALPLMIGAEAVTVVTVISSESKRDAIHASLERVVRHLQRHGIPAQSEATLKGDLGISDILLSRASDLGADLIVAGAYHHSPYREALFGGVTRRSARPHDGAGIDVALRARAGP